MNLQEQMAKDIEDVFFNDDMKEFATWHNIGGVFPSSRKDYLVVVDNDTLLERKVKDDIDNIYLADLLFYIKSGVLPNIPKVMDIIWFDDKEYLISALSENFGVMEITLSANEGV